jgi:hypothetical protein
VRPSPPTATAARSNPPSTPPTSTTQPTEPSRRDVACSGAGSAGLEVLHLIHPLVGRAAELLASGGSGRSTTTLATRVRELRGPAPVYESPRLCTNSGAVAYVRPCAPPRRPVHRPGELWIVRVVRQVTETARGRQQETGGTATFGVTGAYAVVP